MRKVQSLHVDYLPGDHLVSDPGQFGDFWRDRICGLLQAAIDAGNISDHALFTGRKSDQPDLDDFVVAVVETGRLGIENNAVERKPWPSARCRQARFKLLQDAVAAGRHEMIDHLLLVHRSFCHLSRRGSCWRRNRSSRHFTRKHVTSFLPDHCASWDVKYHDAFHRSCNEHEYSICAPQPSMPVVPIGPCP